MAKKQNATGVYRIVDVVGVSKISWEDAAKNVIEPVELARFFDGLNIRGFLDHADDRFIARRTGTEEARIGVGDVVTDRAFADFFFRVANCIGKGKGLLAIATQQVEGEALRSFLADAGKAFQFFDQPVY